MQPNLLATVIWERCLETHHRNSLLRGNKLLDYLVGDIAVLYGDADFMKAM
jgi:hypothetical protein